MPSRFYRITRGEVALVCGLTIAGMNYDKACLIAGVGQQTMRNYLPPGWYPPKASSTLTDRDWRNIRAAFESGEEYIHALAKRYGIGIHTLYKAAKRGEWKLRKKGPRSLQLMTPHQRYLYRAFRYDAKLPREEALEKALA